MKEQQALHFITTKLVTSLDITTCLLYLYIKFLQLLVLINSHWNSQSDSARREFGGQGNPLNAFLYFSILNNVIHFTCWWF